MVDDFVVSGGFSCYSWGIFAGADAGQAVTWGYRNGGRWNIRTTVKRHRRRENRRRLRALDYNRFQRLLAERLRDFLRLCLGRAKQWVRLTILYRHSNTHQELPFLDCSCAGCRCCSRPYQPPNGRPYGSRALSRACLRILFRCRQTRYLPSHPNLQLGNPGRSFAPPRQKRELVRHELGIGGV